MPEVLLHFVLNLGIKEGKVFFIVVLTLKNETMGLMNSQRINIMY